MTNTTRLHLPVFKPKKHCCTSGKSIPAFSCPISCFTEGKKAPGKSSCLAHYLAGMNTANILIKVIGFGLLGILPACQPDCPSPVQKIDDPQVRHVLDCAFAQSGDWDQFSRLRNISYTKRSVLLDSLGKVESDVTEIHDFTFGKNSEHQITRLTPEGDSIVFRMRKDRLEKTVNGKTVQADSQEIIKAINTAHYTLLMPWKLTDAGTRLSYEGIDTLMGSVPCHVLEASYASGEPWRYYFDEKSCEYLAAWASHGPFGALVMNDSTTTISGLTFNTRRTTYRTWEKQKPLWQRALFYYNGLKLTVN